MSLTSSNLKVSQTTDLWNLGVLPLTMLGALSALIGIYWDIAWHIDKGRDSFFSPPHNFVYLALSITLLVSLYALVRDRRATAFHLRLGQLSFHPGIAIIAIAAALDLLFAPADDLWHRLFGADVSLWAPMHLIGLTASVLLAFGGLVTSWLERKLKPTRARLFEGITGFFAVMLLGNLMLLLAEYEFNVPAFPMFWHPLLLSAFPVLVLVMIASLRPFAWAASWTALLFSVFRLLLALWLMLTASFDLAGLSRPAIPILILTGLLVDVMVKRGQPLWLVGLVAGALSLLSSYPVILASHINWYPQALLLGVPAGLALSVGMAYLAHVIAKALGPAKTQ
jgi:hypothetical protein